MSENHLLPINLIRRTICINYGDIDGSAFVIDFNDKNLLITARHILADCNEGDCISFSIYKNKGWLQFSGKVYLHPNSVVDAAVIELDQVIIKGDSLESKMSIEKDFTTAISERGFFVGFSMEFIAEDLSGVNNGFPFGMVRSAVYSGWKDVNGISIALLDGNNNPGFSGGPVFFHNTGGQWGYFGMVSAYHSHPSAHMVDDKRIMPHPTNLENSGIIICYRAGHIKEIIDRIS